MMARWLPRCAGGGRPDPPPACDVVKHRNQVTAAMPYAVTLRLDSTAAAAVEHLWHVLADQAGADLALQLGYQPHITLAVLPDSVLAPAIESVVGWLAAAWRALPLTLAGLAVFPGEAPVLWAAPVPSERLLQWHRQLHAAIAGYPVHPHYHPDKWVPHLTLAKEARVPAERLLAVALSAWDGPIHGTLDRLDLVRFRPVSVLRSDPLALPAESEEPRDDALKKQIGPGNT